MHRLLKPILVLGFLALTAGDLLPAWRFEANSPAFHPQNTLLFRGSQPFSGRLLERYQNGLPYREVQYHAGRKEGLTREFALNGRMVDRARYQKGQLEGLREGWYSEGPRRFEFHYRHGLLEGTQTEWHLTGAVFRQQTFHEGREEQKKILYSGGEIFTNLVTRAGRTFGLNGGTLCMETRKEGEVQASPTRPGGESVKRN